MPEEQLFEKARTQEALSILGRLCGGIATQNVRSPKCSAPKKACGAQTECPKTLEVASGRKYQETESEYNSVKGLFKGLESQLQLFHLNLNQLRSGKFYNQIPIVSPIDGYVEQVNIKVGQFVQQQTENRARGDDDPYETWLHES